jgi:hypothetical protein
MEHSQSRNVRSTGAPGPRHKLQDIDSVFPPLKPIGTWRVTTSSIDGMNNKPNVILRGGPADGEVTYYPALGEPMPFEDVGGGSITYVDTDELAERDGITLRVYEPEQ